MNVNDFLNTQHGDEVINAAIVAEVLNSTARAVRKARQGESNSLTERIEQMDQKEAATLWGKMVRLQDEANGKVAEARKPQRSKARYKARK